MQPQFLKFQTSIMDHGLNVYQSRVSGPSREIFLVSEAALECITDLDVDNQNSQIQGLESEQNYAIVPAALVVDQIDIKSIDAAYIFDHFSFETRINSGRDYIDHEYAVALVKARPKISSILDMKVAQNIVICDEPICFASFKLSGGGFLNEDNEEVMFNVELSNIYAPLKHRNANKSSLLASSIGVFLSKWISKESKSSYYKEAKVSSSVDIGMSSHDFLISVSSFLDGFNYSSNS